MVADSKALLLLSSNVRRQYAEDILTALALPAGATIRFRYRSDYVVAPVDRDVAKNEIKGTKALLAFIADHETGHPFVVPVRYATVVSAEPSETAVIFRLQLDEYVALDRYPIDLDGILELGKKFVDGLEASNKGYYPVVYSAPDLPAKASDDDSQAWQQAVERLALHPTFAESYFIRLSPPLNQKGEHLQFDSDGRLCVVDQQSVRITVTLYSGTYNPDVKPVLSCATDGTFLRVSSDDEYRVALRYDSVEFWLHPASLSYETLSRLTISLASSSDYPKLVPAHARFSVVVRKSRSMLLARIGSTSLGALLVALPAILGPSAALELRIGSAVAGAALLAVTSIVLSSPLK